MSDDRQPLSVTNLPKFGSFWKRPEGKFGIFTLALLGVGAVFALNTFLPILLSVMWTSTKIGVLCGSLFGAYLIVSNKTFRNLVSNGFAALMDKAVRIFVRVDPYGTVRRYLRYLKEERIASMEKNIGTVMGQKQGLVQAVERQTAEAKQNSATLKLARQRRGDDDQMVKTLASKIGRLEKSTTELQHQLDRDERVLLVLGKLHEDAVFVVEDTESAINLQISTHKLVTANDAAVSDAVATINGDPEQKHIFDEAMTFMAEDVAAKIGRIEMNLESVKTALTTREIQNDSAAAAVLADLDAIDRRVDSSRVNKKNDAVNTASEAETVTVGATGAGSDFESLLRGRRS